MYMKHSKNNNHNSIINLHGLSEMSAVSYTHDNYLFIPILVLTVQVVTK